MAEVGDLGLAFLHQKQAAQIGGGLGASFDPLRREMITAAGQKSNVQMQDILAQARQRQMDEAYKQSQRSARHSIAESQRASGHKDLGDMFDGYENPEQIAAANEKLLEAAAMQKNLDLADAPVVDYNHLNARKIAGSATPTELVRSLGDGSYTTNAYNTNSAVQTSGIGDAFIREKNALAAEHGAQAERARAGIGVDKAANYDIVDTPLGKVRVNKLTNQADPVMLNGAPVQGKPTGSTGKFTDAERLALMGGAADPTTGQKTVDPVKLGHFFETQQQQPGKNDAQVWNSMRQQEIEDNTKAANTPSADMQANLAKLGDSFAQPAPAPAQAAAPGKFVEGQLYTDANGKKALYKNGQFIEQ